MSTSLATGIVAAEVHAELEQSATSSSRQPSTIAAAETAAAEGLTLAPNYDRPTRRAQSLSARTSPSFHSLSPPVVSPVHDVELSQSVPLSRGRAASSQRVVSQRAPSLSPSQSTFSYGAPSPAIGSDIEAEYPAARPLVFLPRPAAASVDRARPVAASVDVGRMLVLTLVAHAPLSWPTQVALMLLPRAGSLRQKILKKLIAGNAFFKHFRRFLGTLKKWTIPRKRRGELDSDPKMNQTER